MIAKYEILSQTIYTLRKIGKLILSFVDMFKDIFFTYYVINALGGITEICKYPTQFNAVYVFLMVATIIMPLILSGLHLAHNNPGIIFHSMEDTLPRWTKLLLQAAVMLASVLTPILLINAYEAAKEKMEKFARKNKMETIEQMRKCQKIKKQHVEFLKIELALEAFFQVSGQVLLLLLRATGTPTVGGLMTSACWPSSGLALHISVALGVKTCCWLHLKSIMIDKEYLPTKAKLIVLLWGLCASLRRLFSTIAYFVPALGLCDLLYHWRAEQVPFTIRRKVAGDIMPQDEIKLYGLNETVMWSQLDRFDYTDPEKPSPPPYSLYTGLSLKNTFIGFMIICVTQFAVIFLIKIILAKQFRRSSKLNQVIHVIENINIPTPYKDWDVSDNEDNDNDNEVQIFLHILIEKFKQRLKKVEKEMLVLFISNSVFTVISMLPLWYTGISRIY